MKTYIKKVIVFDQPRKDEKSSNPNRVTVGAVVFDNLLDLIVLQQQLI